MHYALAEAIDHTVFRFVKLAGEQPTTKEQARQRENGKLAKIESSIYPSLWTRPSINFDSVYLYRRVHVCVVVERQSQRGV